jgi:hypothetical protein
MRIFCLLKIIFLITLTTEIIAPQKVVASVSCEASREIIHSPETLDKIDYWTDYFFYLVRPELKEETINRSNYLYRREKTEIRQVVRGFLLCSCYRERKNHYLWKQANLWVREDKDYWEKFYSALTDAVFYARHPERNDTKTRQKIMHLSTEWIFIRQSFTEFAIAPPSNSQFINNCSNNCDRQQTNPIQQHSPRRIVRNGCRSSKRF